MLEEINYNNTIKRSDLKKSKKDYFLSNEYIKKEISNYKNAKLINKVRLINEDIKGVQVNKRFNNKHVNIEKNSSVIIIDKIVFN